MNNQIEAQYYNFIRVHDKEPNTLTINPVLELKLIDAMRASFIIPAPIEKIKKYMGMRIVRSNDLNPNEVLVSFAEPSTIEL